MLNKRELQKQNTRQTIYNSATYLFKNKGFDNVTIFDICKRSKVATGTFYVHFSSKSEILVESYKKMDSRYKEAFESQFSNSDSIKDMLTGFVRIVFMTIQTKFGPDLVRILYAHHLKEQKNNYLLNKNRYFYQTISELTLQLIQEYKIDTISHEFLIDLITSALRGSIFDWAMNEHPYDLELIGTKRFAFIINAICK